MLYASRTNSATQLRERFSDGPGDEGVRATLGGHGTERVHRNPSLLITGETKFSMRVAAAPR
jgi:hypothetical protein